MTRDVTYESGKQGTNVGALSKVKKNGSLEL